MKIISKSSVGLGPETEANRIVASTAPTGALGAEPPAFLLLLDLLSLVSAFGLAYGLAPTLKNLLLHGTGPIVAWVALLSPEVAGGYRPIGEVAGCCW